jgi:hypothetical protein
LSEEKPIFYLNAPWSTVGSGAYNPPQRIIINTSGGQQPPFITINPDAACADNSMMISISEYNSLLSLYMNRGDEITRLQAVVRNVTHYLLAKKDIGELTAVEDALLLELEEVTQEKKG